jgi:hypothetical protein
MPISFMSASDDYNRSDDLAEERPEGVDEQKVIESQETETEAAQTQVEEPHRTEVPETTTSQEQVNEILEGTEGKQQQEAKKEDSTGKMLNQFTKHIQTSKIASDKTTSTLKQIQKQLTQIEKITVISNKQHVLVKQLTDQVRAMQKQLDKIVNQINRINISKRSNQIKKKK